MIIDVSAFHYLCHITWQRNKCNVMLDLLFTNIDKTFVIAFIDSLVNLIILNIVIKCPLTKSPDISNCSVQCFLLL